MNSTSTNDLFAYTNAEVESLLSAYQEYNNLSAKIAANDFPAKKVDLLGSLGKMQNLNPRAEAEKKLQEIGDGMKFQNPLIWLRYKLEAYKGEPDKELRTVGDLIAHCKVDGICHRRFDAINTYLRGKHDGKDLTDPQFVDPSLPLEELARDPRYVGICFDLSFQVKWSRHENNPSGKWRDYAFEEEPHEEYSCGCC